MQSSELSPPPPRGIGRPKDPAKRAAILAAAKDLFLSRGFGDVTMEAVAAAARVSKMTVYGHFPDKENLFEAVVRLCTGEIVAALSDVGDTGGTLQGRLRVLGVAFLEMLCRPEIVAADRTLKQMLAGNRAMALRFYEAGPGFMRASLGKTLAAAARRGELDIDDALEAADDLLSLWTCSLTHKLALGILDSVSPEDIARRVDRKIGVFLRAYRADDTG